MGESNIELPLNNENHNLLNTQRFRMFKCESNEYVGESKVPQFYQTQQSDKNKHSNGRNGQR